MVCHATPVQRRRHSAGADQLKRGMGRLFIFGDSGIMGAAK